ncbi:hypothetical protein C8R44DRAFT_781541 [Mycena epipterygia]|nr:hypothetical protein C8R44DRAFT_781541 [Mycena epipterygia]
MSFAATLPPSVTACHTAQKSDPRASRLAHLLESNDIPLDSEIPFIRQIISDNEARVDALNPQIDVLGAAMEELVAERDQTQQCIRKHAAVLSAVRRVPSELISRYLP